jgi:N-acetylmuramoyl-L-alanine amidase
MTSPVLRALPLRAGARGEAVVDLQQRLAALGHDLGGDPVGELGAGTQAAITAFQQARGLRIDGICGDETWGCLVDTGRVLGERLLYERAPLLRGDDVARLQALLGELGFDAGKVDGFFGPDTTRAVTDFQRNAGLPTDGILGPDTLRALERVSGRSEPGATLGRIKEVDLLRRSPAGLAGRRISVSDGGEARVLTEAVGRLLRDRGAEVEVRHHPDEGVRAQQANDFAAGVAVEVVVREDPSCSVAFYAREGYESAVGRRLAQMVCEAMAAGTDWVVGEPVGMRLRLLRDTRMPAIVVELGPPALAVEHGSRVAVAIADAVTRWASEPVA